MSRTTPPEGTKPVTMHLLNDGRHTAEFLWTGCAWTTPGATISTSPEGVWNLGWRYERAVSTPLFSHAEREAARRASAALGHPSQFAGPAGVTPCQTEQDCEVPDLCKATGGCERMEPVCSRGCPSTQACKAIRSGGECTNGVMAVPANCRQCGRQLRLDGLCVECDYSDGVALPLKGQQ